MENAQTTNTASQTPAKTNGAERARRLPTVAPRMDVFENADEVLVLMDVPGVKLDEVRIDLERDRVKVSAESSTRSYLRVFTIPEGLDAEHANAVLTDGVLRLRLPKAASQKLRRIEVKAG